MSWLHWGCKLAGSYSLEKRKVYVLGEVRDGLRACIGLGEAIMLLEIPTTWVKNMGMLSIPKVNSFRPLAFSIFQESFEIPEVFSKVVPGLAYCFVNIEICKIKFAIKSIMPMIVQ